MVQVIPQSDFGSELGRAIAGGFEKGFKGGLERQYKEMQKQQERKQLSEAIGQARQFYSNSKLSPEEKQLGLYEALAGYPEVAQHLGGQLSKLGKQQQEQSSLAQSFQNIQTIYNDPDLSDDQKIFSVYQEFPQNPKLAQNIVGSLQQQNKARGEDLAGKQFASGYNAILEGDTDTLKTILEDQNTPLPVKRQLTELKNKYETRKDVQSRELRSRQGLVQKSYKQAIANEREKLKGVYRDSEIAAINKNIKKLEALQKNDLRRLSKNPEVYTNLSIWNAVDPDFLPEEEENNEPMAAGSKKMKFNPKNPEHVNRAKQVLAGVGGDRIKANQVLAEEFDQ